MQTRGGTAVMARRVEPPNSLEFFPTPPWATRAFFAHVAPALAPAPRFESVLEPAAGEGHMAEILKEYVPDVRASDVFDYGRGYAVADFLDERQPVDPVGWVVTNPPFSPAGQFLDRALRVATEGVAIFIRTQWAESEERYLNIFRDHPPALIAIFTERVALLRGRWVPNAASATSYAWFVWQTGPQEPPVTTRFLWIPFGCKRALTKPDDARRFGFKEKGTLL